MGTTARILGRMYEIAAQGFRRMSVAFLLPALFVPVVMAQRNRDVDPHDVEAGSTRYTSICASCHGLDGDQVAGVDLAHDRFRRAFTDQGLVDIIRNGIPGTGMPANRMSENAATAISVLWKATVGGSVQSSPITYLVNGRQYISVNAGNSLFTFGLK